MYWYFSYKSCFNKSLFLKIGPKFCRLANIPFQNISKNPKEHSTFRQKSNGFCNLERETPQPVLPQWTYSRSRTLPPSPRVDLGLSSGVSGVSSGVSSIGRGKGVTKGLSSALVGAPLSMVTYSNGLRVTLYF